MEQIRAVTNSNVEVMPGTRLLWLEESYIAAQARPGQFVTVRCGGLPLRRPLSIHHVSPNLSEGGGGGGVGLLFRVMGKGTEWLSQRHPGDELELIGPLGNGFSLPVGAQKLLLIGGGIGIAPLVFLARYASLEHSVTLIHGAATAAETYPFAAMDASGMAGAAGSGGGNADVQSLGIPALADGVRFVPVTEDGSLGVKGVATDLLPDFVDWADQVYACGPVAMYRTMLDTAIRGGELAGKVRGCQVSLEVRLGCGIGSCYGCTIGTEKGPKRVCRDGPVFRLGEVLCDELRV